MSYRIFETDGFSKDIAKISQAGGKRISKKLQDYVYPQLKIEPHFGSNIKRLKNYDPPTWRYRIGAWRFFFEINEKSRIVFMTVAFHRSEAYRK